MYQEARLAPFLAGDRRSKAGTAWTK